MAGVYTSLLCSKGMLGGGILKIGASTIHCLVRNSSTVTYSQSSGIWNIFAWLWTERMLSSWLSNGRSSSVRPSFRNFLIVQDSLIYTRMTNNLLEFLFTILLAKQLDVLIRPVFLPSSALILSLVMTFSITSAGMNLRCPWSSSTPYDLASCLYSPVLGAIFFFSSDFDGGFLASA